MGIYLPNMEMPRKGQMLVIFPDGTSYVCFNGMRERLTQTTAVPVPPHGKLGDLDALINKIGENVDKAKDRSYDWWYACTVAYDFALAAPTIIPAELPVLHGTFAATSEKEALKRLAMAEEGEA